MIQPVRWSCKIIRIILITLSPSLPRFLLRLLFAESKIPYVHIPSTPFHTLQQNPKFDQRLRTEPTQGTTRALLTPLPQLLQQRCYPKPTNESSPHYFTHLSSVSRSQCAHSTQTRPPSLRLFLYVSNTFYEMKVEIIITAIHPASATCCPYTGTIYNLLTTIRI